MKRFFSLPVFLLVSLFAPVWLCQTASAQSETHKIHTVVLDAGHGGHDAGCSGADSKEKDVALDMVLRLGAYIEKNIPDVKVIYTRKTDVFIPLHERAAIANRAEADLFISIHCNANGSSKPYGTETYVMGLHVSEANLKVAKRENNVIMLENDYNAHYDGFNPASPTAHIIFTLFQNAYLEQSISFASKIEHQMEHRVGRHSRGVKQAGFLVLYKTAMPSVLIETGFLSNPKEEKFLNSDDGKAFIASAVFRAFRDYKNEMDTRMSTGVTVQPVAYTPEVLAPGNSDPALPSTQKSNASNSNTPGASNEVLKDQHATDAAEQTGEMGVQPQADEASEMAQTNSVVEKEVLFRVQFYASTITYKAGDPIFSALNDENIIRLKENNMYKYLVGDFSSAAEAAQVKKRIAEKGYSDAFVVAYRQGERISIQEARKAQ